ncbi:sugar/pyridoxal phosphate phosphatase YigL [Vibrio sp. HA2012]|uniref:Cof-type HAD-IIB family hydrolase n=1 Tax=Vibrio sp. HA2012 TaxID=1971595 RepID=UPI000C2C58CF|nr:Cof-type HAD-IIB family hydrolase [Vibrio sp. HA2012]PJC84986.1 sugar/pyridoxal phosphate phosphatase YigL [Vibrio sp. HA2012]
MTTDTETTFKIVASDLDGTLLAPSHQLSEFTKETLRELNRKGYTFTFATGRHHIDVSGIRGQADIPAYMITSNGARVHDQNDQVMFSKDVPEALVQPVIDLIKTDPAMIIHIYQDDRWLLSREEEQLKEFHKDSDFPYMLFDVDNAPSKHVVKIFFTYQDHDYLARYEDKLKSQFGDQLYIAFSSPWCLEVMAPGVSKGAALKAVAESMGLSLQNCIAFGDGMNDVEMLSMAEKGLLMETAHEKVKAALPDIEQIGSNVNDSVAHYLEKHLF